MPLTNRVAILIGASGQLGPAVSKAFAHAGAKLVLVGTHPEPLAQLFQELGFRESRVMTHAADASDPAAMGALAQTVKTRFGHADILLHLAGAYRGGSLLETTDEIWEQMLDVNLRTAIHSTRAFLPLLLENNWGRIVTISSGVTQNPPANSMAYVTAKAALETMTLALAQEVKDKPITANVVLIRALDTPAERAKQPNKKTGWVKPEEVAATLLFLCSEEAGAINGARIPVTHGN
jgi:NAD(P)-dependent dehydrogenase (short-subunit alcohol dehydrogenase family)